MTTFTYDADGRRVVRDTATETVVYGGPHYELRFDKTSKPEDLDDDCLVTVADIMAVAAQWGTADPQADVNSDGTVDIADVQQVAGEWRERCQVSTCQVSSVRSEVEVCGYCRDLRPPGSAAHDT